MSKELVGAVIVAAGSSRRMGGEDKIFSVLHGQQLLARVIDVFQNCGAIGQIVVVLNWDNIERGRKLAAKRGWSKVSNVCLGGERRQDSVKNGLSLVKSCKWVVIHDGARPFVTADLIERGLEAARETGAAIAGVPATDTIKLVDRQNMVIETPERERLWAVQTPQVFRFDIINEAYGTVRKDVTDDASIVESAGGKVKVYMGSNDNIKVTTPGDLEIAKMLLRKKLNAA